MLKDRPKKLSKMSYEHFLFFHRTSLVKHFKSFSFFIFLFKMSVMFEKIFQWLYECAYWRLLVTKGAIDGVGYEILKFKKACSARTQATGSPNRTVCSLWDHRGAKMMHRNQHWGQNIKAKILASIRKCCKVIQINRRLPWQQWMKATPALWSCCSQKKNRQEGDNKNQ